MTGKPNRAERIIAFLESRYPGWVPAIELEPVGGRQAWRTAVSEARAIVKGHGDDIENRTRQMIGVRRDGAPVETWTLSEYRLKKQREVVSLSLRSDPTDDERLSAPANAVPHQDGQDLREVRTEKASHDLNEPWALR